MSKSRTVSMLELRQHAGEIVARVRRGENLVLTYRGRPALRLVPVVRDAPAEGDGFYRLAELADRHASPLTNDQIDDIVYGK
jgi:prevent-host-death family protein